MPLERRPYILLLLALLTVGMGQTIVFAVLPPLGREIGLSEFQVGSIVAASSITFFFATSIWGRVSDSWGRRRVLLIGLVGYTLGTLVFASGFWMAMVGLLTPLAAFVFLTLARMLQSTVMSATPPAASAWVADLSTPETRTKAMGGIGAANNVGAILGPAVGGLLAALSLLLPLYVAAGLTLLAAVLVMAFAPRPPRARQVVRRERLRYTDPRILPFVIVGVLMFMGVAIVQQTLAFRFQDIFDLDAAATARLFGLAMMVSAVASLVAQIGVVQRMELAPLTLLRTALPLLLVAFVILGLSETQWLLFTAMAVQGFGMGLAGPGFMAGASLAVSAGEQGAVAGVANSCPPLGFTIGPLVGTALYQVEPVSPYLLTVLVYLPLLVFVWRVRLRDPDDGLA